MISDRLASLQPHLFEQFQQILQKDQLNHAYLFSGGFASFDIALYLAQSRFCENLQNNLPCGVCRACRLIEQEEFSDVKIVEPSGQVIKTDTIRSLMREFSRSGFEGQAQFFIIKDCDKMHVNAANSLLKVIEEPQSTTYIILLTSDDSKVLATIKSRTQIFQFLKNEEYLQDQAEKAGLLKSQANLFAQLAETPEQLEELCHSPNALKLLQACQSFLEVLLTNKWQAYLEVSYLVSLAGEKAEQDMVFQLLVLLLAKSLPSRKAQIFLERVQGSRQMWQRYVSFQNALEYMVLS